MKIQTPKRPPWKKPLVWFVVACAIVLGGAAILLHPFNQSSVSPPTTNSPQHNPASPSATPSSPSDLNHTNVIPPAQTPTNNEPFPVENSHYKIVQDSDKAFTVTLYAVINNPSQHDEYIAQLKTYKAEALAYLNQRFGQTSNLSLTWNPPAAKDL